MQFHEDGKASLDHIYTQPDPRTYFGTLCDLQYQIPQHAKPYFARLIDECGAGRVLDIGCSYGINAALLRCDATMDELYEWYAPSSLSREDLLARDRRRLATRRRPGGPAFVGLDVSGPALAYAHEAGFIDVPVEADLEAGGPDAGQRTRLAGVDLAISTGCVGYVTERTIDRIVRANGDRPPWMAHFVLRMYPFAPVQACLEAHGYRTTRVERMFRQRRFVSREEQSMVLDTLSGIGHDPCGLEADGWLYAELFISRPRTWKG